MVLALDIAIEESTSIVDVYDQIFCFSGSSIYDRCINNSRYGAEHRISKAEIRKRIHQVSQRLAFWIFENNSEKAFVTRTGYEEICERVIDEMAGERGDIKRDFLIGNYFKLTKHCEGIGTEELQFVHRSIYEYFVAVYFFESVCGLTSKEQIAGKLGILLKYGRLSQQILKFIKYKFDKTGRKNLSDVTREIFRIMLRDGMTYHAEAAFLNAIDREMNIFLNMLEIMHLWSSVLGKTDDHILAYLRYNNRGIS